MLETAVALTLYTYFGLTGVWIATLILMVIYLLMKD